MRRSLLTTFAAAIALISGIAPGDDAPTKKQVDRFVIMLDSAEPRQRAAGNVGLALFAADNMPALESAAHQPGLPEPVVRQLQTIINREKPRMVVRARRREVRQKLADWNSRTALEAYDRDGKKDAKWNEIAKKGLVEYFNRDQKTPPTKSLETAIEAGCDDPMVMFAEAQWLEAWGSVDRKIIERFYELAMNGFANSKYPAYRSVTATAEYFRYVYEEDILKTRNEALSDPLVTGRLDSVNLVSRNNFPKVVQESIPPELLNALGNQILHNYCSDSDNLILTFDPIFKPIEAAHPDSLDTLLFKGEFYITYAWRARGFGRAEVVRADDWKKFHDRLAIANQLLTKAWEKDHDDPRAATLMLRVELGQGNGIDVEKKWFDRAMAADPDNTEACSQMLLYLQPRWYGTLQDLADFGKACRESENWVGGVTWLQMEADSLLATSLDDPALFMTSPALWRDVQETFEPYLIACPDDHTVRSRYALWAYNTAHYAMAKDQFDRLASNAIPHEFWGPVQLKKMQEKADAMVDSPGR